MTIKGDELQVQFLRWKPGSSQFSYPQETDIAHVPREDVVKILPLPVEVKGTSRTQSVMMFQINFEKFGCVK